MGGSNPDLGDSDPDFGFGSLGRLGSFGDFGGAGTGDLGLLGDVPPMGGPDFGLDESPIDAGAGFDAGGLLPTLDDDAEKSQSRILQCLTMLMVSSIQLTWTRRFRRTFR